MRRCRACGDEKPTKAFYAEKSVCMRCVNRATTDRIRRFIDGVKSGPCMDCGQTFPPHIMEFDHRIQSEKRFTIADAVGHRSLRKVREELAKTDLVCSNCHAERTWVRRQP